MTQHITPVDHWAVQDDPVDESGVVRPVQRLQDHGSSHGPSKQGDPAGSLSDGILDGSLNIAPLREAQVVTSVGARWRAHIVAVHRNQGGATHLMQHRQCPDRFLALC